MNKQRKSESKPPKAESPKPQAGLCPVDPLDECPQEAGAALEWIRASAREMADVCRALCSDLLSRKAGYKARDADGAWPTVRTGRPTGRRLDDDELARVKARFKCGPAVCDAVLRFMPHWVDMDFWTACRKVIVAEKPLLLAAKEWNRLELEAKKRLADCELRKRTAPGSGAGAVAQADMKEQPLGEGVSISGEAKALALLVQHPEWTDSQIAKAVGVNRTTLYEWHKFKAAKKARKSGRQETPEGSKDGETGQVESWETKTQA
jgi:hypothetical protein